MSSVRTWLVLSAVLVAAAVAVGTLGDIRFASGSDASGKAASARVMAAGSTCDPDVGWWAADVDPDGDLHQLLNTEIVGDRYVQATSPVYQCAVMPLQRAFGPWGPVLVSIAGALAAALGGAAVAARIGAEGPGQRAAFVLIGIAGPVFHYATDAWEHAPAVGAMTVATALVLGPPRAATATLAGALVGLAVTLRAEMLPYAAALVVAGLTVAEVRRRWLASPWALAAGAGGAGLVVVAGTLAERALVSGAVRADRSAELAGGFLDGAGERATTVAVTAVGFLAADDAGALVLGAGVTGVVLVAARRIVAGGSRSAVEGAGALVAVRWAYGTGFVPGAFLAAPFALAGVAAGGGGSALRRWIVTAALLAMPLVWLLQWPGNLVAQWGGRYVLTSGVLLTAAGCAAVPFAAGAWRRALPLLVSCAAIGMLSAVWHVERTNAIGALVDLIEDVPPDTIVVSTDVNLAREAGGTYGDVRWLAAGGTADEQLAVDVVSRYRPQHLTVVSGGPSSLRFPDYEPVATLEHVTLDTTFTIVRLERRSD